MSTAMRSEEEIRQRMEEIKKLNRGWYWKKHKLAELEWVLNKKGSDQAAQSEKENYESETD